MKKLFLILFFAALPVVGYEVFQYNEFPSEKLHHTNEQLLFVIDFSQSMSEKINGESKSQMVAKVLEEFLPQIPEQIPIGLRVYGHKCGLTAYHACKASQLVVPINNNATTSISQQLRQLNPRGMTPITYSLKQAVTSDFGNFKGTKHIILFTDGGENCDESPCKYAIELSKLRRDFVIDVIAFNIGNKDDLEQLECTALVTKGEFYQADTKAELVNILDKIIEKQKRVEAKVLY